LESGQTAETALLPGFSFRRVARFISPRAVWLALPACCLACGRGDRAPTRLRTDAVLVGLWARGPRPYTARTDAVPIGFRARGPRPSPCPYGRGSLVLFGLRFPRAVS